MKVARTLAVGLLAGLLAACSVTHRSTTQRAEQVNGDMQAQMERQRMTVLQTERPLYKRIPAVYVGNRSAPIALNAALPPALNELSFQLPRRTNLATAAKNIAKLTRYPVRINPDVYIALRSIVPAIDGAVGNGAPREMPGNLMSAQLSDGDTSLPTDFEGPLKDYLDTICGVLNINWEFDPAKGFYFYRLVTKVFEVKLHAGDNVFTSNVSKGATASVGTAGNSGTSTGTGAYSATTTVRSNAVYAPWTALETALNSIKTPLGRIAVDISSNSVLVRDTREVVDQAEQIIQRNNEVHNRQITLHMRVMRVAYDDTSAAGMDFNAAYNRLLAGGGSEASFTLKSPGSLLASDSGGLGYSIVSPTSRWRGTEGMLQAVNQLGAVVSDDTTVLPTMNRRTVPIASFDTDTYLAETTPSTGSGQGGGGGAPGLKPATLTTGFFVQITPTAFDDGSVWLDMTIDQSAKRGQFGTATAGAGETFQQIQLPNTHADSKTHAVAVKPGEALLLVSISRDTTSHSRLTGLLGASANGERHKELQIIVVTPYVRAL